MNLASARGGLDERSGQGLGVAPDRPGHGRDDLVDDHSAGRAAQCLGTRRAIDQSGLTFSRKAGEPFMCGAAADARSACGGLRRLPAQHGAHHLLSTDRR